MSAAETESKPTQNRIGRQVTKRLLTLCGMTLAAGIFANAWVCWPEATPAIPESVSRSEYDQAAEDFANIFRRQPTEADVIMMLAESAVRSNRNDVAVDCFAKIPSDHRLHGSSARLREARLLLQLKKVDRAENSLREYLRLAEDSTSRKSEDVRLARELLVYILAVELRFEERKVVLQQMQEDRQFDVLYAKQFYFPALLISRSTLGSSRLRDLLKQDPTNLRLLTAQARHLVGEGKTGIAQRLLETLRRYNPADRVVIAVSLECCYELNNWSDFENILSMAPEFSDDEPWLLTQMRGEFAAHTQNWALAEKCFRQVLSADPSNPTCHMGLSKVLNILGRAEERTLVQNRSLILARLRVILPAADNRTPRAVRAVAEAARMLQMDDAAAVFEMLADSMNGRVR